MPPDLPSDPATQPTGPGHPARDRVYADPRQRIEPFRFDDAVAHVFPDMIRRSVPGYATMVQMTGVIAGRHALPGSVLYDLGCSLGAVTLSMRHHLATPDCRIIGIDNAPAMLAQAQQLLAADAGSTVPVELRCEDIRNTRFSNASVVALNFTLQFIPPADRLPLLQRIRQGMLPGGALVLAEKIRQQDAQQQEINNALHLEFKRAEGYTDLEIAQKRSALEQVLIPDTLAQHTERLQAAGFVEVTPWFHCFNFISLIARTPA